MLNGSDALLERVLTEWGRGVGFGLANIDRAGGVGVRESLPHLVVTGGCGCVCASFNVSERRYPARLRQLAHLSNGVTADPLAGFVLWLGPDGRPSSVDVENEPEGA